MPKTEGTEIIYTSMEDTHEVIRIQLASAGKEDLSHGVRLIYCQCSARLAET